MFDPGGAIDARAQLVAALPDRALGPPDVLTPELRIWGEWDIACHWAPFDHVPAHASMVLVGVNPGIDQALTAFTAARDALRAGAGWHAAQDAAKRSAAYTGPLRTNLLHMLDEIGLAQALGVTSAASVIGRPASPVHLTYAVRHPVSVLGRDYDGRRPQLLRYARLAAYVFEVLGPELEALPEAIVVPLGRIAGEAVAALVEAGRLDTEQCLLGMPHPSGANGHRESDFGRARLELRLQVEHWFARHPVRLQEQRPA